MKGTSSTRVLLRAKVPIMSSAMAAAAVLSTIPKKERRRRYPYRQGVCALAALTCSSTGMSFASASSTDSAPGYNDYAAPQPYIIGGVSSSPGRYPYLVSLGISRSDHACAATLIAPDMLLSAAHCDGAFRWATLGMYDRSDHDEGMSDGRGGRQYIRTDETVAHPAYRWTTANPDIDYDFLLVKLTDPADVGRFPPVKLNRNPSVPSYDNQRLTITGWGATDAEGLDLSPKVLHGTVGYVSPETCDKSDGYIEGDYYSYRGFLTNSMMCAWSEDVDACLGDSGGPLLLTPDDDDSEQDVQVGIVSFGVGCNSPDFPGLYSRVSDQIGWIDEVVCSLSDDPPADFECARPTRRPTATPTSRPTRRPSTEANEPSKQSVLDFLLGGAGDQEVNNEDEDEVKPTPSPTRRPSVSEPDRTSEPTTERVDWSNTETAKPTSEFDNGGFVQTIYATSGAARYGGKVPLVVWACVSAILGAIVTLR